MSSVRHPREEKVDAKKRWKKVTMERIRLKTNGFERDGAIPTDRRVSNETSFSHARPSREKSSRGCFVTRRNNASEVSVLISHHFLFHRHLSHCKRTVPRNHAFAVARPVKPFNRTGKPNKNTVEFTSDATSRPGD